MCPNDKCQFLGTTVTIVNAVNFLWASRDSQNSRISTISANFTTFRNLRNCYKFDDFVLTFIINHQKFITQFININDALVNYTGKHA